MDGGSTQWEVLKNGEPSGPFDEAQVLLWLREGEITSQTEVRPPGRRAWKTVVQVAERHEPFAAALMPVVPATATSSQPAQEPAKRCPYCAETILARAIRCKHCRADLVEPEKRAAPAAEPPRKPSDVLGSLMALTPIASTALIWFWVGSMNLFQSPASSLALVGIGTVVVTSVLGALEASHVGAGGPTDLYAPGKRRSGPITWFIAMMLLWIICFPAWLYQRSKYGLRNYVLAGVLFGGGFLFSWVHMGIAIEEHKARVRATLDGFTSRADEAFATPRRQPALDDLPAEPSLDQSGNRIGIPACDRYFSKMEACLARMPREATRVYVDTMNQNREAWRQIARGSGRETLIAACDAAAQAIDQMPQCR